LYFTGSPPESQGVQQDSLSLYPTAFESATEETVRKAIITDLRRQHAVKSGYMKKLPLKRKDPQLFFIADQRR
jgi:hypothetical protein